MIKVGITGRSGFIGSHLWNMMQTLPEKYELVKFKRDYFSDNDSIDSFVRGCDVIVHLAGLNRHDSGSFLYETNVKLASSLISGLDRTNQKPHVIVSSSVHEKEESHYGKSKKKCRELFSGWAARSGAKFTGLLLPNVFGPFGKAHYNSVVATFCDQLTNSQTPKIYEDSSLELVYVGEVAECIQECIDNQVNDHRYNVRPSAVQKVHWYITCSIVSGICASTIPDKF